MYLHTHARNVSGHYMSESIHVEKNTVFSFSVSLLLSHKTLSSLKKKKKKIIIYLLDCTRS